MKIQCKTCRSGSLGHIMFIVEWHNVRNSLPPEHVAAFDWLIQTELDRCAQKARDEREIRRAARALTRNT